MSFKPRYRICRDRGIHYFIEKHVWWWPFWFSVPDKSFLFITAAEDYTRELMRRDDLPRVVEYVE